MNINKLSLDTIPPILTPFRFFLVAPVFGLLAAMLIVYSGGDIWQSRWNNSSLAVTHLLTIGFMLMVMMGALYQFIPVMNGRLVPGSQSLSAFIHIFMLLGVIALIPGFLFNSQLFFWGAFFGLGLGSSLFALSLLPLLVSRMGNQLIVFLLRILYLVLSVTLGLGLFMLLSHAWPESGWVYRGFTDLHAMWGLAGWLVLIIMAISSQVIPMFYVIKEFSKLYLKGLSLLIVATLVLLSLAVLFLDDSILFDVSAALLSMELLVFIVYTLTKIEQRKRKIADVTINFYRLSLLSLLVAIIIWWSGENLTQIKWNILLAIALIYGLACSIIIGMLHKIVAFLIFLHLQKISMTRPEALKIVPNMKQVISASQSQTQFMLQILSYAFLLVSVFDSALVIWAGILMMLNFSFLMYCLYKACALYLHCRKKILACPEISFVMS